MYDRFNSFTCVCEYF